MSDAVPDARGAQTAGAARLLADAATAEVAARQRLDAAIADLGLPGPSRLSDYQRAAVTRMSERLVTWLEEALGARIAAALGPDAPAELTATRIPLALPRLERSGLLHDPELVALLLRRAAEDRLTQRLRRDAAGGALDRLLGDDDPAIAAAAAALIRADARRFDDFQDAAVPRADLPAELQHRLAWNVAAALRAELIERHALDAAPVDRAVAGAVQALLGGYDEAATLDGCALALARMLDRVGRLEDAAVAGLAEAGHVAATVAALAHRAGIDPAGAWDMALDPAGSRLALLLRAGAIGREGAGRILAAWLAHPRDAGDIAEDLDEVETERARAATRLWRLDPAYRAAILSLA